MEKPTSSFWGNISYIGKVTRKGQSQIVVSIESSRFHISEHDPAISHLRVTSGGKKSFVVLEPLNLDDLYRVIAVYGHPKADYRLVFAIREKFQYGRGTINDLADWDPDYLYEPMQE